MKKQISLNLIDLDTTISFIETYRDKNNIYHFEDLIDYRDSIRLPRNKKLMNKWHSSIHTAQDPVVNSTLLNLTSIINYFFDIEPNCSSIQPDKPNDEPYVAEVYKRYYSDGLLLPETIDLFNRYGISITQKSPPTYNNFLSILEEFYHFTEFKAASYIEEVAKRIDMLTSLMADGLYYSKMENWVSETDSLFASLYPDKIQVSSLKIDSENPEVIEKINLALDKSLTQDLKIRFSMSEDREIVKPSVDNKYDPETDPEVITNALKATYSMVGLCYEELIRIASVRDKTRDQFLKSMKAATTLRDVLRESIAQEPIQELNLDAIRSMTRTVGYMMYSVVGIFDAINTQYENNLSYYQSLSSLLYFEN